MELNIGPSCWSRVCGSHAGNKARDNKAAYLYRRGRMTGLRAFLRDHRALAIMMMALALSVKLLIPQGYMVGTDQRVLTVQLCLDGASHETVRIAIPTSGKSQDGDSGGHGDSDGQCAYSSLAMGAMGGADAPLLAIALAFLLALGFAPVRTVLRGRLSHILPPLRGPPAAV